MTEQEPPPPSQLAELLTDRGVDAAAVADAQDHGHLGLLAVDRLATSERPVHDIAAAAAATGLAPDTVAHLWRSLGMVEPAPGTPIYSDADLDALRMVARLVELQLADEDLINQLARVIGLTASRSASALLDAVESGVDASAETDRRFAAVADDLLDGLARLTARTWRRHVRAEARARMARDHAGADPAHRVVGFADLVGFTALSQQLSAHELAAVVDRFETLAYDTVGTAGGRVIKMIGDEVMFAMDDEDGAADLALDLAEVYEQDEQLGAVRVGLAAGPVLVREADLFGPVVNRASRLVGVARPGSVLVDQAVHDALADRDDLRWRSLGARTLKHMGKVPVWVLRRSDHAADAEREPRRRQDPDR